MKNKSLIQVIGTYFQVIVIFSLVFVLIYALLGQLYEVTGDSMYPNFHNGEQLIAEKLSTKLDNLSRGDIVIFKSPVEDRLLIKRVIGLPDERFLIQNGSVYINDKLLNEKYLSDEVLTEGLKEVEPGSEYNIPSDSYFVMGDNREKSTDSREWGPIKRESIIGKAILIYYPLGNMRLIQKMPY